MDGIGCNCDKHRACTICNTGYPLATMFIIGDGRHLCRRCCLTKKLTNKLLPYQHELSCPDVKNYSMFPTFKSRKSEVTTCCSSSMIPPSLYKPTSGAASRRPLQCPYFKCRKAVAVAALRNHFTHEHQDVIAIETTLDKFNSMEFQPYSLLGTVRSRCLRIITITEGVAVEESAELLEPTPSEVDQAMSQRGPATSIPRTLSVPKPVFVLIAGRRNYDEANITHDSFTNDDCIVFYIISTVRTTYCYTISLTAADQFRNVGWSGPVYPLNDDVQDMCDDGKGLILNSRQTTIFSCDGTRTVRLLFKVHERHNNVPVEEV